MSVSWPISNYTIVKIGLKQLEEYPLEEAVKAVIKKKLSKAIKKKPSGT